jgi:hypothetical protein
MTTTVQETRGTRPSIWVGGDESWSDFVARCHAGFKPPPPKKRTEWDEVGDVDGRFCRKCCSHFCPHAAPTMYPSPVTGHEYDTLAKLLELQKRTRVTTRQEDYPPARALMFAKLARDGIALPALSRGLVKKKATGRRQ